MVNCIHCKNEVCGNFYNDIQLDSCRFYMGESNGIKPQLCDGWRDYKKETPANGELILVCYDKGDRLIYGVGEWCELEERCAKYNGVYAWRKIDPPAFA